MQRFCLTALVFLVATGTLAEPASLVPRFEIYGVKSTTDLREVQAWGFEQVVLESNDLIRPSQELGLSFVQANWWHRDTQPDQILSQIHAVQHQTHLISVNMMDEPIYNGIDRHPAALYSDIRNMARQNGSEVPLSLTIYGPKEEWDASEQAQFTAYLRAVDIIRIDPYPVVAGRPLRTVFDWVQSARAALAPIETKQHRHIPITVILQSWSPEDDENGIPQLPSPAQLRVMAYLAFFSGAETVSFFSYDLATWGRYPGFQDQFQALIRELHALRHAWDGRAYQATFRTPTIMRVEDPTNGDMCLDINTTSQTNAQLPPLSVTACSPETPGTKEP